MRLKILAAISFLGACGVIPIQAAARTSGADFLNLPVGAEPAAMGGAYSALATDVYAPVWNPGAMSRAQTTQLGAQHLAYLDSMSDETFGFVHPFQHKRAFGATFQTLGTGNIAATDVSGNSAGSFSARYGAYSLAYGESLTSKLALGLTGKMIDARIDDVSAHAFAMDVGSYYQATPKLALAGVLTNVGGPLKFIDQSDSLPLAFHLGAAYQPNSQVTLSLEGVYRKTTLASLHGGIAWSPVNLIVFRAGYRTDVLDGLSPLAGLTMGFGFNFLGQTLSYAWVPMAELGNTQYLSIVINFGKTN